jgi:Flp pilus assembly protein TadG
MRLPPSCRRGAVALEYALVVPVFLFLVLAMMVGGLGVFRNNEVACLTREAARWAAVRGGQYALDTGEPAATPETVYQNAILARAVLLDTSKLAYSITWDDPGQMPTYLDANGNPHTNRVHVTLSYKWLPELFLGRATFQSTTEMEVYN